MAIDAFLNNLFYTTIDGWIRFLQLGHSTGGAPEQYLKMGFRVHIISISAERAAWCLPRTQAAPIGRPRIGSC